MSNYDKKGKLKKQPAYENSPKKRACLKMNGFKIIASSFEDNNNGFDRDGIAFQKVTSHGECTITKGPFSYTLNGDSPHKIVITGNELKVDGEVLLAGDHSE